MDPIDRPDFNRSIKRAPNVETMARMRGQVALFRSAQRAANDERAKLNEIMVYALKTGHSYRQISEVTGFSVAAIQGVAEKAGLQ